MKVNTKTYLFAPLLRRQENTNVGVGPNVKYITKKVLSTCATKGSISIQHFGEKFNRSKLIENFDYRIWFSMPISAL